MKVSIGDIRTVAVKISLSEKSKQSKSDKNNTTMLYSRVVVQYVLFIIKQVSVLGLKDKIKITLFSYSVFIKFLVF